MWGIERVFDARHAIRQSASDLYDRLCNVREVTRLRARLAAERAALDRYLQMLAADLTLSFSDGSCYLEGRTFPERALGQTAMAQRENVSPRDLLPVIPEDAGDRPIQLLAHNAWEKNPGGTFQTEWSWGTANTSVSLQMFPDRLLITLESLREEKYVFQRPRL